MKTVTYRGPEDPHDRTSRYKTDGFTFPKGTPVHDVPDEVARTLEETEGQTFEIADEERSVSQAARKLAAEKGIDLDSISGDGSIGVDDVRAAIQAREDQAA